MAATNRHLCHLKAITRLHIQRGLISLIPLLFLAGCNAPATQKPTASSTAILATITLPPRWTATSIPSPTRTASATPTITLTPTLSPTPTASATITTTPAPLPAFTSRLLRVGVEPAAYLNEPCEYLRLRWSLEGSTPGTVVVPIMFHGIRAAGKELLEGDETSITEEQFQSFVWFASQNGYQTITTAQLIDFLHTNARIPPRSMILIIDDRRPGTVENYLLPTANQNNWTITLGWLIGNTDEVLWAWMERLYASGRLDVQSHGYNHIYITEQTTEEVIREEIFNPIAVIQQHFGQRPVAFIWPGGNFTSLAVSIAQEYGYQLGFTAFSRGPLMFNWIPQGEEERAVANPLMTLPRSWSTDQTLPLDNGIQIGAAAQAEAIKNYAQEAAYYRMYCGGELPPLEEILPTPTPRSGG
jgi:peptidoglycan/xylan/chitin deacetylase (PgdA/CDA1 family)